MTREARKTLIAIPSFNSAKFIEKSIISALNQTKTSDVILFDNQSTDETVLLAKKFEKSPEGNFRIIVNDKNYGRTGNWNQILDFFEKSKYEYLKFLFSGDELLPSCIEEIEKIYAKDKYIGAIVFPYYFVHVDGSKDISGNGKLIGKTLSSKSATKQNLLSGSILGAIIGNVYAKKYLKGLRFNSSYIGKADFDIMYCTNCKVHFSSKILAVFNAISRNHFAQSVVSWVDMEFSYIQLQMLNKLSSTFSKLEVKKMQEKIVLESIKKQLFHFSFIFIFKLIFQLLLYYPKLLLIKLKCFASKNLPYNYKKKIFKLKNMLWKHGKN